MPVNSDAWLAERKKLVLTASEAPTLMGVGYQSYPQLLRYHQATFRGVEPPAEPENEFTQEAMRRGHDLEESALLCLDSVLGKTRTGDSHLRFRTLTVDGTHWGIGATPDAFYDDGVGEAKCPMFGVDVSVDKFFRYWLQVQIQLWVCVAQKAYLMIYHPDDGTRVYKIYWMGNLLWEKFVDTSIAPFIRKVADGSPGRLNGVAIRELKEELKKASGKAVKIHCD